MMCLQLEVVVGVTVALVVAVLVVVGHEEVQHHEEVVHRHEEVDRVVASVEGEVLEGLARWVAVVLDLLSHQLCAV